MTALKRPRSKVTPIGKLDFDQLAIPTYQRPYKWTAKNVNQLISDIITFRHRGKYRLGTLVLHRDISKDEAKGEVLNIVDGQQRIITLTLLLRMMYKHLIQGLEREGRAYGDFIGKLDAFIKKTKFSNEHSCHNVLENIQVIKGLSRDFSSDLLDFILEQCEFVVVELDDLSEAFQFFDSQNSRGKALAPHDLMKAYHLREIPDPTKEDLANIEIWVGQKTEDLQDVFLSLYRVKRWSLGKSAKYFTKDNIETFKGIPLADAVRYPYCQLGLRMHHFVHCCNSDSMRSLDGGRMDFPFGLDQPIINGSRFFDMLKHYIELYNRIKDKDFDPEAGEAVQKLIKTLDNYPGCHRVGDQYVRSMFDVAMLYYMDRFGKEELDKVLPKIFVWAYQLRLRLHAVHLSSIDNYAREWDSMLMHIRDAKSPYEIVNWYQRPLREDEIKATKCEAIYKTIRGITTGSTNV